MARLQSVRQRRKDSLSQHPTARMDRSLESFFRIILQHTIQDKKLSFPSKFVKKYGGELTDIVELSVPNGRVWQMGLIRGMNDIWLDCGWHSFVQYHSICHGYFLVFDYMGMSHFNVLIFNMSACEIQYPPHTPRSDDEDDYSVEILSSKPCASVSKGTSNRSNAPLPNHLEISKHSKSTGSAVNQRRGKKCMMEEVDINENDSRQGNLCETKISRAKISKLITKSEGNYSSEGSEEETDIITSRNFSSILERMSLESKRAVNAAEMCKPQNPSFMVILQLYNIRCCLLHVPAIFAKKYLNNVRHIKLQISGGKEWPVQVLKRSFNFWKGWPEFLRDNYLEAGDVCLFELISLENFVLNTSIFRASSFCSGQGITTIKNNAASMEISAELEPETRNKRCVKKTKGGY